MGHDFDIIGSYNCWYIGLVFSGCFSPAGNVRLSTNPKLLPEPPSSRSQDDSTTSSSMNEIGTKSSQDDESSPPVQRPGSSVVSPQSSAGKSSS